MTTIPELRAVVTKASAHNTPAPAPAVLSDFDYSAGCFRTGKHAATANQWLDNAGVQTSLEESGDGFRIYAMEAEAYFWPMGPTELAWQAELADL